MPGDGDKQPRPGPRKRPPERPGAPAQQHDDRPSRPRAPERPSEGAAPAERSGAKGSDARKRPTKKAPANKAGQKAPTKKASAKKASAKRAPTKAAAEPERPPTAGAETPPAKKEAPAKQKKAAAKKKAAPARRPPQRGGAATSRQPSERPPGRRPPAPATLSTPDEHDRTAAVPSSELFAPSSPDVVVRPSDAVAAHATEAPEADAPVDTSGPVDLAAGAPLVAPEDVPPPPPAWPEAAPAPPPERPPKQKKLRGKAKRIHKAKQRPPSRLLNHYDVNGPRIRLGFLWFLTVGLAIAAETAVDLPFLALLYGSAAGFAGWQAAREWRKREDRGAVPWAAAAGGAAIGFAGALSPGAVGVAVALAAGLAVAGALVDPLGREEVPGSLALTLQCGLFPGIAAASIPLVWRVEPGAAITLFLLVSAYEVGDYVVGSGSLNAFEGPIAGVLAVAALMLPLYGVQLPPIDPDSAVLYGAIVAIGCPLSQIVGSAVLPWSDAPAPALRRLDSLMLTGPIWLGAIWFETGVL